MSGAPLRALRAEALKYRTGQVWWVLALVLMLGVGLMAAFLALMLSERFSGLVGLGALLPADEVNALVYSTTTSVGYVVPILAGALLVTGEYRHGTLAATFTAQPRRGVVLLAKTVLAVLVGAFLGVVGMAGSVGAGALATALSGGDPQLASPATWRIVGASIVAMALWCAIGLGLGLLVGNQAAAITIALVFTQFIEPVLRMGAAAWPPAAQVGAYLPGSAADAFVGVGLLAGIGDLDPSMAGMDLAAGLPGWAGLLVLVAYAVLMLLLGWALRWRRDLV